MSDIEINRTPTMAQVITTHLRAFFHDKHFSCPCSVEEYDKEKQVVTIKLGVKDYVEQEDGSFKVVDFPNIPGVPVCFPGGGGFRMTFPLKKGDTGLAVFSEKSIDEWQSGQGGSVDPIDLRQNHISDAQFVLGAKPNSKAWTGASDDQVTIGYDGGPQILLKQGEIHFGAKDGDNATEKVLRGNAYLDKEKAFLDNLKSGLGALKTNLIQAGTQLNIAAGLNAVPMTGGAAAATNFTAAATFLTTVASAFATIDTAVETFKSQAPTTLSDITKTK